MFAEEIITRKEARARGLKRYYMGAPCDAGHLAQKHVYSAQCVVCASETKKLRYAKNREIFKARMRATYEKGRNRYKALARARYYEKPDHFIALTKARAIANPERERGRQRIKDGKRRARKLQTAVERITLSQIRDLLESQQWKCAEPTCRVCIRHDYHIDHIIPLASDGTHTLANLQGLCPSCNLRKSAKHPIAWAQENGRLL